MENVSLLRCQSPEHIRPPHPGGLSAWAWGQHWADAAGGLGERSSRQHYWWVSAGAVPSPGTGLLLPCPDMAPLMRAWPPPVGWCPSMPSAWSQGGAWCPGLGVPPAALLPGWGSGTALASSPRKQLAHWVLLCDSMIQAKLLLANPSFSTSTWAYSMHTCVPMQCFVVFFFFSLLNNALIINFGKC